MESLNQNEGFIAGSPDGITASGRLIEVKCPFRRKPNGVVPAHYVHQVQTLMHILQLKVCDFIEYVPAGVWTDEVFSIVTIERDDAFWARVEPLLRRFWDEVVELRASGAAAAEAAEAAETARPRRRQRRAECLIDAGPNPTLDPPLETRAPRGPRRDAALAPPDEDELVELAELANANKDAGRHDDDQLTNQEARVAAAAFRGGCLIDAS
jgi:hypothetical protein